MKLTNKELRQLIKEELQKELQLNEQSAASIVTRAASAAKSRPNNQMAFAWVALDHMAEMLDKLNAKQAAAGPERLKEESGVPAYGLDVVPEALRRIEQNQQHIMHTLGQILNKS